LERVVNPGRLQRGRSYARRGQVLSIDFERNRVQSRVQGSRSEPYKVSIEIRSIDDKQWGKVVDVMAGQAIYAAKLLAGEMPADIEGAFGSANVSLFPARSADLRTECSCPDDANPCKHISAVYYLLGERFDEDPFLLFQLRGRSKDQIIGELRGRRGVGDRVQETAGADATLGPVGDAQRAPVVEPEEPEGVLKSESVFEPGQPLEELLEVFWDLDPEVEAMQFTIARPAIHAAAVKRLGQPGFWKSKRDFMTEMESIYSSISEAAIKAVLED
jgi:uncharacterized Zn finger protein